MFKYSDDFYERACFLKQEQVPTQSIMKKKMSDALAQVYFKSMTPKLKVLAGLEPPMKGGGANWYVPPKDLLQGECKLKPEKSHHLKMLGFNAIYEFGDEIVAAHQIRLEEEKKEALSKCDDKWKKIVLSACNIQWAETSRECQQINTRKIQAAFQQFTNIYSTSITKIEGVLFEATFKEARRVRKETSDKMMKKYETFLKQQATMLYDRYHEKLMRKKAELKSKFIKQVEEARTDLAKQLHDINVEKHRAVEKVRNLLQCQNMACQVYVALKEREECKKELDLSKHEHKKKVKSLDEEILLQDFEIRLLEGKEKKRQEFYHVWQKKICHVVKRFQIFVEYCLKQFPEHAEFFISMEKLMLLQLEKSLTDSRAESIIVAEEPEYRPPVPHPHPVFVYRDKSVKVPVNKDLCPVHCTSSASIMPVIVINKRCIYASCDNIELSSNKVREYLSGKRGDDSDFQDSHDFNLDVPVKITRSHQMKELKLESSLMQILQEEIPNLNNVPLKCCVCKVPYCFCSPLHASKMSFDTKEPERVSSIESISSGKKITLRAEELKHEREPKIESYIKYIRPKKCACPKTAKMGLEAHLPPYMRKMSKFENVQIPHYEPCSVDTVRKLVKRAMGKKPPPPEPEKVPSKTKDIGTQYSDQKFDFLCSCLSDDELMKFLEELNRAHKSVPDNKCDVDGGIEQNYLNKTAASFASDRAYSLRVMLDDDPQLEDIFNKPNCDF